MKYKTIQGHAVREIPKIKGSRFIAYAYSLEDQTQVKPILADLEGLHPQATHICYAYRSNVALQTDVFGNQTITAGSQRSYDAGEPTYTAWKPIERTLQSYKLENILIAVVRYFWGTQLGIGGLIKAYWQAAEAVISQSVIVEQEITIKTNCHFPLSDLGVFLHTVEGKKRGYHYHIVVDRVEANITCAVSEKENMKTMLSKHILSLTWS